MNRKKYNGESREREILLIKRVGRGRMKEKVKMFFVSFYNLPIFFVFLNSEESGYTQREYMEIETEMSTHIKLTEVLGTDLVGTKEISMVDTNEVETYLVET